MSIFKDSCIVIKKKKLSSGEILYTLFSKEYGKVVCSKKISAKEKPIDTGNLIHTEISCKQSRDIHSIRNIHIKKQLLTDTLSFNIIHNYLELVAFLDQKLPDGMPSQKIFECIETLLSKDTISEEKILLCSLKIQQLLGILPENHRDINISKILRFIHENPSQKVLLLKGISEEVMGELRGLIQ
ncbi:hypothetical protein MK079_04335 [Candidatus Gracilibacteria bacterium]|nr:hypothetical protein [Candidatus Gracilibacteria bacterium]